MWHILYDNPVPLNELEVIALESKAEAVRTGQRNITGKGYHKDEEHGYSMFWHVENYDIWSRFKEVVDITEVLTWGGLGETRYALRFWEWNGTQEIYPHIDPDGEGIGNLLVPIIGEATTTFYGWWDKELTQTREKFPTYDWTPEEHGLDSVTYGPGQMMSLNASRCYHGVRAHDTYRLLVQFKLNESVFPQ